MDLKWTDRSNSKDGQHRVDRLTDESHLEDKGRADCETERRRTRRIRAELVKKKKEIKRD